jgi:hypothetical protein
MRSLKESWTSSSWDLMSYLPTMHSLISAVKFWDWVRKNYRCGAPGHDISRPPYGGQWPRGTGTMQDSGDSMAGKPPWSRKWPGRIKPWDSQPRNAYIARTLVRVQWEAPVRVLKATPRDQTLIKLSPWNTVNNHSGDITQCNETTDAREHRTLRTVTGHGCYCQTKLKWSKSMRAGRLNHQVQGRLHDEEQQVQVDWQCTVSMLKKPNWFDNTRGCSLERSRQKWAIEQTAPAHLPSSGRKAVTSVSVWSTGSHITSQRKTISHCQGWTTLENLTRARN